jgi:predicted NUDIX family NTP pyrophosphohydrolase
MPISAGLLPFRRVDGTIEVLIAHPGGPFFARKSRGAWSLVKGLIEAGEDPLVAARREFTEETGWDCVASDLIDLGQVQLKSGKVVTAWAFESDFDLETFEPGTFEMEWQGSKGTFPEIDRVLWTDPDEARPLLNPAQVPFIDRLIDAIGRT